MRHTGAALCASVTIGYKHEELDPAWSRATWPAKLFSARSPRMSTAGRAITRFGLALARFEDQRSLGWTLGASIICPCDGQCRKTFRFRRAVRRPFRRLCDAGRWRGHAGLSREGPRDAGVGPFLRGGARVINFVRAPAPWGARRRAARRRRGDNGCACARLSRSWKYWLQDIEFYKV